MFKQMRLAERWLPRFFVLLGFLIAASLPAAAGVTITGASPSTFSGPGETITFTFVMSDENAIVTDMQLVNMNKPLSGLSCSPDFPIDVNGTTTCTATYETTATDTIDITEYGSYELTTNGGPRGGNITGQATVTYAPVIDPAPTVTSVSVPANGNYGQNTYLTFTISFDANIVTMGNPLLELDVGGLTGSANLSATTGNSLVFTYFTRPGDEDPDGISISGINLNGGTIKSAGGTPADLTLNGVPSTAGIKIDAVAPEVLSSQVINNPPSNASNATFQIVFSEPVTGFTISDITLAATGTAAATLSGLSTSDNKTYTVQAAGVSGTGTLRADVVANGAQDVAGNGNPAFTSGIPWTIGPSTDANLDSLAPSAGSLNPAFASGTLNYSVSVPNSVDSISLTPTAAETNATITVAGSPVASGAQSSPVALTAGTSTPISVVVTAQDGTTTKTYTVTVTRAAGANADLSALVPGNGSLDPAFASGTLAYDVTVENTVDSITFTPTAADSTATITVNGAAISSGETSGAIALPVGATAVSIEVTAQDGTTKKTYTVTVTRKASATADLASLTPSAGTLSPGFDAATLAYNLAVGNSVDSVTFTPTAAEANATISVNGSSVASGVQSQAITLAVGSTSVSVVVTAQDGTTTKTYTVTVVRAAASNAALSGLVPSVGTLSPAFSATTFAYSVSVDNTVGSIFLTPTVADTTASVTVNGSAVASGSASAPISVAVGTTDVSIIVTAQDGTTTKTYTVTVIRSKPLPTATSRTIEVVAGTSTTVDLTEGATGSPFTAATLTSVPGSETGTVHLDAAAQQLTFDASPTFSGSAGVGYTLTNAVGTSAPATITFAVISRPDPSQDPEVIGLLRAQVDAAKRFAQYQTRNFNNRLEQLHDEGDRRRNSMDIRLGFRESNRNDENRKEAEHRLDQMSGNGMPGLLGYADETGASQGGGNTPSGSGIQGPDFGPYAVWAGGFVDFAERDKGGLDIDSTAVGISAGIDYRFSPQFVAGFGIGYGHDKSDVGDNGTESRANAYSAAVYGSYKPADHLFIDGLIGGSWLDYDSRRYVTANGDFANGSRDGRQIFGSLTAAYEFRDLKWLVSPYGRFELSRSWLDGFTEKDGGIYGLTYGDQTVDTVSAVLGVRASYDIIMDWGKLTPGVRAEFTHDFAGSSRINLGYADLGSLPYAVDIDSVGSDYATLGLSLDAAFVNDWTLGLEYRTAFGSGRHDHAVGLKVGAKF